MSSTLERTGAALGEWEQVYRWNTGGTAVHTPICDVEDPGLRNALTYFDSLDERHATAYRLINAKYGSWNRSNRCSYGQLAMNLWGAAPVDDGSLHYERKVLAFNEYLALAWRETLVSQLCSLSVSLTRPADLRQLLSAPAVADARSVDDVAGVASVGREEREDAPDESGQSDAVLAIDGVVHRLGLPVRDVLKAASVRKSSYYSWRRAVFGLVWRVRGDSGSSCSS